MTLDALLTCSMSHYSKFIACVEDDLSESGSCISLDCVQMCLRVNEERFSRRIRFQVTGAKQ